MRFAGYVCLVGMMFPHPALAGEATDARAHPAVAGTLATSLTAAAVDTRIIHRVDRLLQTGKLAQARALLAPLRHRPVPALEVLFLSGMIDEARGDFISAAKAFRQMLARNPRLPRPRLELARVLFRLKDYAGAKYNFQQVMATDIPVAVRRNVTHFLGIIDNQVPTLNVGIEMISDSNPLQQTSAKVVNIGGLNYTLNTTAPNTAVNGLMLTLNTRLPWPSHPSWYTRLGALVRYYPHHNMNQAYFQASIGKRLQQGRNTLSVELGAHQYRYQRRPLYHGALFRLLDTYQQRPTLGWQFDLERRNTIYTRYPYLNGWQQIASLYAVYTPSVVNQLSGGLSYTYTKVQSTAFTFTNPIVFIRISHELKDGFITGASMQYGKSSYQGIDPFFGTQRKDRDMRAQIYIQDRQWQLWQFSPRLMIGYIHHTSNISLYAYKRAYVNLGVFRAF